MCQHVFERTVGCGDLVVWCRRCRQVALKLNDRQPSRLGMVRTGWGGRFSGWRTYLWPILVEPMRVTEYAGAVWVTPEYCLRLTVRGGEITAAVVGPDDGRADRDSDATDPTASP